MLYIDFINSLRESSRYNLWYTIRSVAYLVSAISNARIVFIIDFFVAVFIFIVVTHYARVQKLVRVSTYVTDDVRV